VALRRLRSALSTFKGVVRDDRYDQIRAELRWIAAELGHARNLDVLLERVSYKDAAKPLRAARKKAYAAVQTALASDRARASMLDLSEWTAIGTWSWSAAGTEARAQPIEQFAASALEKHRRRLKRLGRELDEVGDEERHEARIEGKKLRYATEFFASLFRGKKATRRYRAFYDALEELQAHLGDLDAVDQYLRQSKLIELAKGGSFTQAAGIITASDWIDGSGVLRHMRSDPVQGAVSQLLDRFRAYDGFASMVRAIDEAHRSRDIALKGLGRPTSCVSGTPHLPHTRPASGARQT
jgi:CHAD domain-containing protein